MSFLNKTIELFPAYGRTYQTIKSFTKDWNDNKDFHTDKGSYTSKEELLNLKEKLGIENIFIMINHKAVYTFRNGELKGKFA